MSSFGRSITNIILTVLGSVLLLVALTSLVPFQVSAQSGGSGSGSTADTEPVGRDDLKCGSGITGSLESTPATGSGSTARTCATISGQGTKVENLITTIINVMSALVGAVAVVMIIYGGFRYVTAGGDSNSVGSAKNTIIFAVVGLIIVAFAQIIVRFVLQRVTEGGTPATPGAG